MRGIIDIIKENISGSEFGFILGEDGLSYYFDSRFLIGNSMEEINEDDNVEFTPDINRSNQTQRIAKGIRLILNKLNYTEDRNTKEETNVKRWYNAGRSEKLILDSNFSKEEFLIMDKFKSILFHSYAGHFKTRQYGVEYGFSLFGPTKNFVLQLGLEKVEFVMIFCDKDDFQRRSLETFSYLTTYHISETRVINHFFVFVTKCNDIISHIQSPEIQNVIQSSIIPFTYDELCKVNIDFEKFVLARFKKFLFERDFFSFSEPITEINFLFGGRLQYANNIVDRCISGNNSGLFGLRKSGKTSILHAVMNELGHRDIKFINYRCIEFINLEWFEALYKIIKDIYKKSGYKIDSLIYTEKNAIELFQEDLDKIIKALNLSHYVIIFDEIEQISYNTTFGVLWKNIHSFHFFWSGIISYSEKNPEILSIVVAGINPSISEVDFLPGIDDQTNPRNPMYNKLSNDNYIKPFVYEQIKKMVNTLGKYMGLRFDDSTCYELFKDYGGHPYLTRQMCKLINNYIKENTLRKENDYVFIITKPLYQAVKKSGTYQHESFSWCKDILKELKLCYKEEYNMLIKIINHDNDISNSIKSNIRIIPHLLGYGLLIFDKASNEVDISIDVIKEYLIAQEDYEKPFSEMTIDEIDEEVQDGILMCEQPIRNLIFDVLSTTLMPDEAIKFILQTSSFSRDNNRRRLDGLTLGQLLDPCLTTLHFSTLTDIICSYDKIFGNHYEYFKIKLYPYTKDEIKQFMSSIYISRNTTDHHFLVRNEATLNIFRVSLKELKKILTQKRYI